MVAVIFNHRDEVLVALRNQHSHQGGLWEFPGGKPEPGEPHLQALHREIHEETGLRLLASHPLCRVEHRYSDKHVLLDVHLVSRHAGEPSGKEGQRIEWRARQELLAADFPAANTRIVELLRLPETITITPDVDSESEFLELMRKLIASGKYRELVQVRQTQLSPDRYRKRFLKAVELAADSRTRLLFNNLPEYFELESPDCGFHASSRILAELDGRPVPPGCLFSASCHSPAELRRAETLGADFVLLSPVARFRPALAGGRDGQIQSLAIARLERLPPARGPGQPARIRTRRHAPRTGASGAGAWRFRRSRHQRICHWGIVER